MMGWVPASCRKCGRQRRCMDRPIMKRSPEEGSSIVQPTEWNGGWSREAPWGLSELHDMHVVTNKCPASIALPDEEDLVSERSMFSSALMVTITWIVPRRLGDQHSLIYVHPWTLRYRELGRVGRPSWRDGSAYDFCDIACTIMWSWTQVSHQVSFSLTSLFLPCAPSGLIVTCNWYTRMSFPWVASHAVTSREVWSLFSVNDTNHPKDRELIKVLEKCLLYLTRVLWEITECKSAMSALTLFISY
ncbi:hypothetical protein F5B22DRAFT_125648 [Xylaria bambusicola]|uniref:uncharacterized protein n=1 Tax=Xylaria bambusicola TaxID=326684 RepID=UPI0020073108|nr:uncharacterized protein F5B22DRAFT_125648 [Xylaria bambusicola]KAI0517077.1 hypothetical protein F5B22DRAFT_125648 [Xylaria bambusicola]